MSTVPDFPARPGGKWISEDRYEFDAPIELAPGQVAKTVDFSQMEIPEGITREQVLEAFTDPKRMDAQKVPEHYVDMPIKCPQCGKEGTGTVDMSSAMIKLGLDPFEEEDVEVFMQQIDHLMQIDGGAVRDNQLCPVCTEKARG